MIVVVNVLFLALAGAALLLAAILALEIVVSRTRTRLPKDTTTVKRAVAVVVPAHNEGTTLESTLDGIRRQLGPSDRLVVIADNCTDDTAAVARSVGAEVVERDDLSRVGKGYALDAGIRHLVSGSAPEIVIFIDADCAVAEDAIESLARACAAEKRPVQAMYLMNVSPTSTPRERIGAFAWRVKNKVRPQGLDVLSMPCLLTGSGMAFPIDLLREVSLATGHITEDTLISVECALLGRSPALAPDALVTSDFAPTGEGRDVQKSRWVHGHLSAIANLVPRLLAAAFRQRDVRLLALAAEIAIPPLALFLMGLLALTFAMGLWYLATDRAAPFVLALAAFFLAMAALLVAWVKAGRDLIRIAELREIARYIVRQLPIAGKFFAGRRSEWTRSERGPSNHS